MRGSRGVRKPDLILWLGSEGSPESDVPTVRWDGWGEDEGVRSLLRIVEGRADRLRSVYLSWVAEVGHCEVGGRSVIEHLDVGTGLSHWWTTTLVEANVYKSGAIARSLRLLALEEVLDEDGVEVLLVQGGDRRLVESVRVLCADRGVELLRGPSRGDGEEWSSFRGLAQTGLFSMVPAGLASGVAALVLDLWRHRLIIRHRPRAWCSDSRPVLFCGQLFDVESDEGGISESTIWRGLRPILRANGRAVNRLTLFVPTGSVATGTDAVRRLHVNGDLENRAGIAEIPENHLWSHLDWSTLGKVIGRWWRLVRASGRLGSLPAVMDSARSRPWLWPCHQRDWVDSLRGAAAIRSVLVAELMELAVGGLPPQSMGVYAAENHAWARVFADAWRRHGHGELLAYAHATVRFWDLRYHHGQPGSTNDPVAGPRPDRMIVTGALAEAELRTSGLDPDRIVRCEALRYRHLSGRPSRNRVDRVTLSESAVSPVRLLLLGDYAESTTRELFSLVAEMADRYDKRGGSLETILRRHAGARRSVPSPLGLLCRDGSGDLVEIAAEVDIAVAGNRTSAAVDLHVLGVPVVVALDPGDLNCSPLRGVEGVRFAADSRDLLDAVLEVRERSRTGWEKDTPPILDLDPDLSGWSALFSTGNQ